jgi:hypothetical protein
LAQKLLFGQADMKIKKKVYSSLDLQILLPIPIQLLIIEKSIKSTIPNPQCCGVGA